jgi:hypothetical protein
MTMTRTTSQLHSYLYRSRDLCTQNEGHTSGGPAEEMDGDTNASGATAFAIVQLFEEVTEF